MIDRFVATVRSTSPSHSSSLDPAMESVILALRLQMPRSTFKQGEEDPGLCYQNHGHTIHIDPVSGRRFIRVARVLDI